MDWKYVSLPWMTLNEEDSGLCETTANSRISWTHFHQQCQDRGYSFPLHHTKLALLMVRR